MKKSQIFRIQGTIVWCMLLAQLTLTAIPSTAQTAKEIIDKHIKAIGGKAKLDAITSYSFNLDNNIVTYKKPGKWNVVFKEPGKVVKTEVYYGNKGWESWYDGRTGITTFGLDFVYFIPGLLSYAAAPEYKIENPGPDTESDNLRIKITSLVHNNMQTSFTFFINPSTYMVTKVREDNTSISADILLEDYKTINGIKVPMTVRKKSEYSSDYYAITKTNVKLNIPVDDKLFTKPVLKKQLIAFNAGNGKRGYHDELYTIIIKPLYDQAWDFGDESLAKVKMNQLFGFIDKTGKAIIPIKYSELESFDEGIAAFMVDKKWGYMNATGKIVIPATFDEVKYFKERLAAVMVNKKWGFMDKTGKMIIPFKYDQANPFADGRAIVKLDNKWGGIDANGIEVIPMVYESISYFKDGKSLVKKDGEKFYIDIDGKKLL